MAQYKKYYRNKNRIVFFFLYTDIISHARTNSIGL